MDLENFYLIVFFIFGTVMGSFYHLVATRLSSDESIIFPASHCTYCNKKIQWYENIPIISYLLLRGKCSGCGSKISISYLVVEIVTGMLFCVSFHCFHFTYMQVVSLVFISSLVIIMVSDIEYMIILDEVLIVSTLILILVYGSFFIYTMGFKNGIEKLMLEHIYPGCGAFLSMYALKIFGDKFFKKESLGGGDIKLMFLFGLVLGFPLAISTIFLATFIAFPIAIIIMFMDKENIIPFGPFLSMSALLIFISKVEFNDILKFFIR